MSPFVQKILLIVLALLIWFSPDSLSSVIKLTSGKTIEHEITYRDDEMIKVDSGYGIDITYYLDEIESIDGQPPILVEGSVAIDILIEEPESLEVIDIVPEVEPVEEIEEIEVEKDVEILEPIVIERVIEEAEPSEEEIPIIKPAPVKDISVIEEQNQIKELPSPFGPTIRENRAEPTSISPIVLKHIKPVSQSQIANEPQSTILPPQKSMSDKIVTTIVRFVEKQKNNFHKSKIRFQKKNMFIHKKLKQIPVKIRKDIFAVLSLVLICVYVITCFPLMLIANKLKRKRAWLVLIPIVQIFYFVYIAKKPLWWSIFILAPIVNIILAAVLFLSILREMKKSYWLIFPALVPGINIFVIWYMALSKSKLD